MPLPPLPSVLKSRPALLGIAALVALGLGWFALGSGSEEVSYRTAKVVRGDVARTVLAAGAIEAKQLIAVGARVSGKVESLSVALGDEVKVGDVVAQIERQDQENDLLRASAALAQIEAQITAKTSALAKAETALARQEQLAAQKLVSDEAMETATANVTVAKADLAALAAQKSSAEVTVSQSRLALERTTITAPISGTVVAVVVEAGQTVNAASNAPTIVKIANLDKMLIKAEISEADVVDVAAGQKASFTILGAPSDALEAVVRSVEPAPSEINESDTISTEKAIYYNGLLEVDNPKRVLRIGMTAQVSIVLQEAKGVLTIPSGALTREGEGYSVQVMGPMGPRVQAVKVGLNDKVQAEIIEGLSEGDEVVTGTGSTGTGSTTSSRRMGPPMGL